MAARQRSSGWWRIATLVLGAVAAGTLATGPSEAAGASAENPPAVVDVTVASTALPPVTLPPATLPPVTLPPVTVPPVTVPPVTVPPVTVPSIELPAVSLPPVTLLEPPTTLPLPPPRRSGLPAPGASDPVTGTIAGARSSSSPPADLPALATPGPRPGAAGGTMSRRGPARPRVSGPLPLRLRQAAAETAQQLSFPLGLAAAILVFLVVQPRLNRGDPSVAHRGTIRDDDLLGFS